MSEAEGYLRYPAGNVFWYNTDYQVYHFLDAYPDYEYVFMCEYDCTVNIEVSAVIETMALHGFTLSASAFARRRQYGIGRSAPARICEGHLTYRGACYPVRPSAAHSAQFASREARPYPTRPGRADTGNIGAQFRGPITRRSSAQRLHISSAAELPLSAFGDTSHYDWAPPHLEAELPSLSGCAVVHPVLDVQRYLRSLLKLHWDPEDLFQKGSRLHCRMEKCDSAYVIPMFLDYFVRSKNWAAVDKLRGYASGRVGGLTNSLFNVARDKPTTQSSTSRWSRSLIPGTGRLRRDKRTDYGSLRLPYRFGGRTLVVCRSRGNLSSPGSVHL